MDTSRLDRLRDTARLRALADTELMDSPREERFDRYTKLAAKLLKVPTSAISLIDDERHFLKSSHGVAEPWASRRETPLEFSLCKYAVALNRTLVVTDARTDPRVRDSPGVSEFAVGAYLGIPLALAGQPIGVLCVADSSPRAWSDEDVDLLRSLAAALSLEIEHSATRRELREQADMLCILTDAAHDAVVTIDRTGKIVFCNRATEALFMYSQRELLGAKLDSLLPGHGLSARSGGESHTAEHARGQVVERRAVRADGSIFPVELVVSSLEGPDAALTTVVLRDVTERQRATQALRDAEEQLRLIIDHAPIGMAIVSTTGRWLRVNDALTKIVGYSREELLSMTFQRITHPDDLEADLAALDELLEGSIASYEMEKRYIHRAGHSVWIHVSASLVRRADGAPLFFIVQVQDTSARRATEAQARMFFDQSLDMLAITSLSGKLDKVNPAWEKTLGWSQEELTSQPFLAFIHPDDVANSMQEAAEAYRGSTVKSFRNRYRTKRGSYRWLEWNSRPAGDGQIFCIARDVTQQVEREQELRLFQRAIAASSNGIVITQALASGAHPIGYVNPAFERMSGYGAAELIGKDARILNGPASDPAAIAEIRSAIETERDCQVVLRNYRKSGETFLNALRLSPVRAPDGRVSHYIGIAEDITERAEAEEKQREQATIMRTVLDSMTDGVIVTDAGGRILHFNEAAKAFFDHTSDGAPLSTWSKTLGLFLSDRITPCPPDQVPMARALRGESVDQVELWIRAPAVPEGTWRSVTANPVWNQHGQLIGGVAVGRDISARKALEEKLQRASLTDELTGLHNRRGFVLMAEQQLRSAARHHRNICLLFVDLNGMKAINDQLGHEVGDDALIETGALITRTCRSSDLTGRLGGDEFVILTEGDERDGEALRARLMSAVAERNERRDTRYALSISVGACAHSAHRPIALAELIARADRAMYEVKRRMKSSPVPPS